MNLSQEQIDKIQEMAGFYMGISDIAAVIDVPEDTLRLEIRGDTSAGRAYRKGKALTTMDLRRNEVELAKTGSQIAMDNLTSALQEMNENE